MFSRLFKTHRPTHSDSNTDSKSDPPFLACPLGLFDFILPLLSKPGMYYTLLHNVYNVMMYLWQGRQSRTRQRGRLGWWCCVSFVFAYIHAIVNRQWKTDLVMTGQMSRQTSLRKTDTGNEQCGGKSCLPIANWKELWNQLCAGFSDMTVF